MSAKNDTRPADTRVPQVASHEQLFEWQPNYSVKIGIIDKHHQRMFELVNELHHAMCLQKGRDLLTATLDELIDYTRVHFASEEVLMEAFAYPETLLHTIEHDRLTRTVLEFQEQFASGQVCLTVHLMEFLKVWIASHILGSDQKYVDFFAERGAKP